MKNVINKLFIGGKWIVAISNDGKEAYKPIVTDEKKWIADPFLFDHDGNLYLFVELYDENVGHGIIAYYSISDGKAVWGKRIIENDYHMSYPCVFEFQNRIYMIPESSANKTVDLYVADVFPDVWRLDRTLINQPYVDTTVFIDHGQIYLLSYKNEAGKWELIVNLLDNTTWKLKEVKRVFYRSNIGRPAGSLFYKSGSLYRPAQNCYKKYGESIILYKVSEISPIGYSEEYYGEITIKDVQTRCNIDRIHTINYSKNGAVIDGYIERIDPFHFFKILRRKYLIR